MKTDVPNDLYEMEPLGDNRFTVAVPISADAELKRRIMGASCGRSGISGSGPSRSKSEASQPSAIDRDARPLSG